MVHATTSPISQTCQLLLLVLALMSSQSGVALGAGGGMSMLEVKMAEQGSFSYVSLPESGKELLFEKYLLTYSREVKCFRLR